MKPSSNQKNGWTSGLAEFTQNLMPQTIEKPKQICPKCNSVDIAKIAFGYPSEEMIQARERGDIVLGGCCVTDDDPEWCCKACQHNW
jgi:hypothetical protein